MEKIALITGSTDGIGKETAIRLALEGYTIHLLGRNKTKGESVLQRLQEIAPNHSHKLYLCDLSSLEDNKRFLQEYCAENTCLDLLILNANILPQKSPLTKEGINSGFMVSCISRYLFGKSLDSLLQKSPSSKIVHIGGTKMIRGIDFSILKKENISGLIAAAMGFMGDNLLVQFANQLNLSAIPYLFIEPGIVNTATVKTQPYIIRALSKMLGMIEPEKAGELITKQILNTLHQKKGGKFYTLYQEINPKNSVIRGEDKFRELVLFIESFIDKT